ncbi:transcription elongation factor A protein 3-like isoform X10 [Salvelinus namaycush]|uniref:Transcription elongation factor A protein 3-like isoform X10 n=1 Tax=Salvelinus namaycush TaxID=8040 RepID=A0A8U0QVF1_SALNM|nr:transcription elongation factor A protein 3-like isoform X10 [Salvelinus namaycush]
MTREEELIRIAKKLDKMVSRNNTEGALDLLNELKSFNMTLKLLQETRIGMSVNGIRKHCTDDEVVSLAKILIKDWKRLLDAARTQSTERPNEMKNGVDSNKSTASPVRSPLEKDTSHKRLDVSDSDPESEKEEYSDKRQKEKHNVEHKKDERAVDLKKERNTEAFKNKRHAEQSKNGKHTEDARKERHVEHLEEPKKERHFEKSRKERHVPIHETKNERHVQEPKKKSNLEEPKNESHTDEPRRERFADELRKERHTEERRKEIPMYEPRQERPVENHRQGFERRDSSDTLSPSHPRPTPPSRRSSVKGKEERKDSTDSKPSHSVKRHSTDSKSDRKEFHGSKSSHPGPLQRKSSTDSIERRGKPEMPKIPSTPTSPMSPSFSSAGVPLSPCLATGETIRDKCIEMLAAALRTDDNFKEFGTNCDSMAAEIEDHIYTEMGSTDMKYKNRVRSRISNLKDPKNPGLRRNVLAGGIELRCFAIMSAEEMASDELKQLRNNLTKEAIREHQLSKTSGTISDLFQCSKCNKKNCTYNQMQTRSADEPMTTFVLCNECGNRWKFC